MGRTHRSWPRFPSPTPLVVGEALRPRPAHFHQRVDVFVKGLPAGLGAAALVGHNAHVHFVGVEISFVRPLAGVQAQELVADELIQYLDFIVAGALPWHFALGPVRAYGPRRDGGNAGFSKIAGEVTVQVGVQGNAWDMCPAARGLDKGGLPVHPGQFRVEVAEDDKIIVRHKRVDRPPGQLVFAGHEGQGRAGRPGPIA